MDLSDGDLVRLARAGDPAAFRILVERYLPLARARASRLCPDPGAVVIRFGVTLNGPGQVALRRADLISGLTRPSG